jgi:hypothetical protein
MLPALVAALASHYALDVVRRTDTHTLSGAPGGYSVGEVGWAVVDVLVASVVVTLLARRSIRPGVLVAAVILGIPPGIDNVPGIGPWLRTCDLLKPAMDWRHAIQHNTSFLPLGLGTQFPAVTVDL